MARLHSPRYLPAKNSQGDAGEITACLSIGVHRNKGAVGQHEESNNGTDKWMANHALTFHMTLSADFLRDMQPSEDNVKIGNDSSIDGKGCGSLSAVLPEKGERMTVRPPKVAFVPDLAFSPLSLAAAHTRGVGFATDD